MIRPVPSRAPRRLLAAAGVLALIALTLLGWGSPAGAHAGNQSYLYLDLTDKEVSGRIEAPLRDINTAFGLNAHGNDDAVLAALNGRQSELHAYLDKHLDLGGNGADWPITFQPAELFYSDLPEADGNYIIYRFTADTGGATVPRSLQVRFDPFVDEIPGRDALLLIGNDWAGGVIENGHKVFSAFNADSRTQTIDLGNTGWYKTVSASVKLGVNHIRTGPDHILFVAVLVLPSVLIYSGRWKPTASFGTSLWRVLKVVTMFTVAHTITFSLAGLEILPLPPPKVVEAIIAISIAAAALHNIRPIAPNKEWMIAFVFGLFHGMGFAAVVQGLDVPRSTQLLSLLGRNLGIELAQAAEVLLIFPGLYLLRRTRYFRAFFVGLSSLLAAISVAWMIERVFEVDLRVNASVEPFVRLPRALIFVALFIALAAVVERLERRRNRLLPVAAGERGAGAGAVPTGHEAAVPG